MKKLIRLSAIALCLVFSLTCMIPAAVATNTSGSAASGATTAITVSGDTESAAERETSGILNILSSFLSLDHLKESFDEIFNSTINKFLASLTNGIFELFDSFMTTMLEIVFHVEKIVSSGNTTLFTEGMMLNIYTFLYSLAISLVALKFIFKGFNIWVLWRNGDADSSPRDMLIGVAEAVIVMVGFPYLYDKFVDLFLFIADGIMNNLGVSTAEGGMEQFSDLLLRLQSGASLIMIVMTLIVGIMGLVLMIKMISQGFELFIMRLGMPFATLGLIDSDMALFKNYIQVFIKLAFTVIIQVSLMSLALRVTRSGELVNIVTAIALMAAAMRTPNLLSQFLVPNVSGGGMLGKASSVAQVARTVAMFIK